ncbi:unnamed protein product [Parajaminaea phylloscopi]
MTAQEDLWPPTPAPPSAYPLSNPEYQRYGRQLVLPAFGGVASQLKLRNATVLVVGAGGLGCPAVQYLASAGVGNITVVDHDVVERSNLARQILHTEGRVGMPKVESIRDAVTALNPHVRVTPIHEPFTALNAPHLAAQHDLILDCTDNPLTRYLINDAAVLADKMVVSGAAQGLEGQLMVLHKHLVAADPSADDPRLRGPCYRCLFPVAPRPEEVTDCEDGGVLGTITGLIGTLQANEAIKILTGMGEAEERQEARMAAEKKRASAAHPAAADAGAASTAPATAPTRMLLASPMTLSPFRSIKLRPRAANCRACGDDAVLAQQGLARILDLAQEDYRTFCGVTAGTGDTGGAVAAEMTVRDLASLPGPGPAVVLDVRTPEEYDIVSLPRTLHVPWVQLRNDPQAVLHRVEQVLALPSSIEGQTEGGRQSPRSTLVPVVCKRGNDSQLAARALNAAAGAGGVNAQIRFVSVKGGLREWARVVDVNMPTY